MRIEWTHDKPNEGYCGLVRVHITEAIPKVSWRATAEALEQIPGTLFLRPSGRVLSEMHATEEQVRAAAVLLCARLMADEVAA